MNNGDYFRHSGDADCQDAPFQYKRCGLDNIYLLNGFEAECEDGERYVTVLDVDGLHKAIGVHLVTNRKTLAPKEIKFLRRTLNFTQAEMGRLIGQSDQQIARWEKGENNISGPADRLLRLMFVYTLLKDDDSIPLPMEFLQRLDDLDAYEERKVEFRNDGADWHESVLAMAE
ncbi:MAG: helix-turn-helix domain-containing protein [Sphingomonadaceae bacterium]|nr:helix-turn-helix domain-containing protein [Sphingomonadaceae bacterium]